MATDSRWKYLVTTIKAGAMGLLTGVKDEALQEELNQKGLQGWEVVQLMHESNGTSLRVIYRKPM